MTIPTETFELLMPVLQFIFKGVLVAMIMVAAGLLMVNMGGPNE